jgi:pyruvate carboxylase subunit B
VKISYEVEGESESRIENEPMPTVQPKVEEGIKEILTPLEGNFYRTKNPGDKPVNVGDFIKEGSVVAYIESMKVYNAITSELSGTIMEICFSDGSPVEEDDVIITVK